MRMYPPIHTFKKGETLDKIAGKVGYYKNVGEIWNHKYNAKLKKQRKQPGNLEPGDQIVLPVPDKLLKVAREHLDALIAGRDAVLRQQTDLAIRIDDLKWRNDVLKGFVKQIIDYKSNYIRKISKLVDDAVKARDKSDLVQNAAMLGAGPLKAAAHGFRKKFIKKSFKKNGGEIVSSLEKDAAKALNKMGDKSRKMLSSNYNEALKQGMALSAVSSTATGSTGFITDALANEASADTLVGKGLRVVDDATSVAYWGWVAVGVFSGKGWDSFESIESDARKKIKTVSRLCDEAAADILAAMARHDKAAAGYKKHSKMLDRTIKQIESEMDYPTGLLTMK